MITKIFDLVLQLSFAGTVAGVFVMMAKVVGKKRFTPRWHLIIWLLVLIRLSIPFSIPSSLSVFNYIKPLESASTVADLSMSSINNSYADLTLGVGANQANNNEYLGPKETRLYNKITVKNLCSVIWLLGFSAMVIYMSWAYLSLYRKIHKSSVPIESEQMQRISRYILESKVSRAVSVIQGEGFESPFVIGCIKPIIVLPTELLQDRNHESLRAIVAHEMIHIKWLDNVTKILLLVLQSIHWFNPFVWFAFDRIRKDCETACDAEAVRFYCDAMKKKYASTLLEMLEKQSGKVGLNPILAFGESNIKERIREVMKNKKYTRTAVAAAIVLMFVLSIFLLTGASGAKMLTQSPGQLEQVSVSYVVEEEGAGYQAGELIQKDFLAGEHKAICESIYHRIIDTKKAKESTNEQTSDPRFMITLRYKNGKADVIHSTETGGFVFRYLKDNKWVGGFNENILPKLQELVLATEKQPERASGTKGKDADLNDEVNRLLKLIVEEGPNSSSNPYDYLKENKSYKELVAIGPEAVQIMYEMFKRGNENGLREYVMACASAEILGVLDKKMGLVTSDAREWFYKFSYQIDKEYNSATGAAEESHGSQLLEPVDKKDMEDVISAYLLAKNKTNYYKGEKDIEAHKIYRTQQKKNIIEVYMQIRVGWYGFENKSFNMVSGTGLTVRMQLKQNEAGEYEVVDYLEPLDGSMWAASIRKMFPKDLAELVIKGDKKTQDELDDIHRAKAAEYLRQIGRTGYDINNREDIRNTDPKIRRVLYLVTNLRREFPDWEGTREILVHTGGRESGTVIRCILETKCVPLGGESYEITLIKTWHTYVDRLQPVSFWKYKVTGERVELLEESDNDGYIYKMQ